jgi:polyhydroxyalkanoate synthesis repressor PhaR
VSAEASEAPSAPETEPVVVKKYANRRLYDTSASAYVTLDDLADMVKRGVDFVVYDAKTNEDITRQVLTQIIVEEENRGENLLPIQFLRQLIRSYGAAGGPSFPCPATCRCRSTPTSASRRSCARRSGSGPTISRSRSART